MRRIEARGMGRNEARGMRRSMTRDKENNDEE